MRKFIATSLLVFGMTVSAQASSICGPNASITEALNANFGEVEFASGVSASNSVKFYGNPTTGTWTMLVTKPDGSACIVATGEGLDMKDITVAKNAFFKG
jgi:hypothetical protein